MLTSIRLFLDTRKLFSDGTAPLKLVVRHRKETSTLDLRTKIFPDRWDSQRQQIIGASGSTNQYINLMYSQADAVLMRLKVSEQLAKYRASDVRDMCAEAIFGTTIYRVDKSKLFSTRYKRFMGHKEGGTLRIYQHTLSRLCAFDADFDSRTFEEVNVDYLRDFEAFLAKTSPSKNARNIHLRNIRAVFNDALDAEVTTCYPFRRLKIRPEATAKRSLTIEELREFWNFEPEETAVKYHDLWKLTFLLIGINLKDLHGLTEIRNGRIEYKRAKTHRPYSVKVEPEALEIINKYRGITHLLIWGDSYHNSEDLLRRLNRALVNIGPVSVGKQGKKTYKPLQPQLTTYWARHTWATIASSLDIPKDTIAHALGHGGNSITDIYIDFDRTKVDEANRRVIDWVLYGKK